MLCKLIKGKFVLLRQFQLKGLPHQFKGASQKIFVTFRPSENIKDEVSLTSGHDYKSSSVIAASGKKKFSFFSQKNFAWLLDDQEERSFIKLMKKAH